jgi:DUF4097 and DUF4098 domain-containing protein YvlB
MRRRSLTGPILLLVIGGLFLWKNLHPEAPVFEMMARDWPFLLIGWGLIRLVEVLFSKDEGHRGSFSGGEVVLVILICIAGAGMWQASQYGIHFNTGGLQWWGETYDFPVSANASSKGMVRLVFENPHGNIKVTGADNVDQVTVTGHKTVRSFNRTDADRTNNNTPVEIIPQGDRLLIRTNQDRAPDNQRVSDDLEVTIPRNMAVESRGNVGDYEITDIAGDLELAGSRGDVRLNGIGGNARIEVGRSDLIRAREIKGKLDIQGRGSDLELENIGGQVTITGAYTGTLDFKNLAKPLQFEGARNTELSVQAIPGHINMDLGQFTGTNIVGPVRFISGSRDVKLQQFTQSLELETQRGDIELQPKLPMPSIEVRSDVGRIELILPDRATFQLEATAERGDAVNDYGSPIQKESQGRSATLKGNVGSGPTVHLTANRGSVEIRKEGTAASDGGSIEMPKAPKMTKPPSVKDLKDSEVKM